MPVLIGLEVDRSLPGRKGTVKFFVFRIIKAWTRFYSELTGPIYKNYKK